MTANKYEKPGQPIKYNPEQLEKLFNDYIIDCIENTKFSNVVGFCNYIGMHKDTYYEYSKKLEYSDAIKRIEGLLEDVSIQSAVAARNPAFMIFYMKNKFNYVDKQEITQDINMNDIKVKKPTFDE